MRLQAFARVLVIRTDEIGDVVLTAPFLRELRRALPTAHIALLVKRSNGNLVERCPYIDEVLLYDWTASRRRAAQFHLMAQALRFARKELWRRRFELVITPRSGKDHAGARFVTLFSRARCRIGYRAMCQGFTSDIETPGVFTHAVDDSDAHHEVTRGLDLLQAVGVAAAKDRLELWLDEDDERNARHLLSPAGRSKVLVAFGIGAGAARRTWPTERFVELGQWLRDEYGARIVLLGGAREEKDATLIARALGGAAIDTAGKLTLRQAGALLGRCALYVGNDTGVMHLAAAAGTPVVAISCHPASGSVGHAQSPARFGPWGVPHTVLQPATPTTPCIDSCSAGEAHCILTVQVSAVRTAVREHLYSACADEMGSQGEAAS